MPTFKIKFKPNRRVINNFIKCFGNDPIMINNVMKKARNGIIKYWYNNVYEYFDARKSASLPVTGQLGRSLRVDMEGKTKMSLSMVPMHNDRTKYFVFDFPRMPTMSGAMTFTPFSMPGLGMGREMDLDYGKLLREGFAPSNKGYYSFQHDCKVMPNGGRHPGYNRYTRWVPWMNDFTPMARQILAEYMLREMKKIGVNGNIPQWRVDINI